MTDIPGRRQLDGHVRVLNHAIARLSTTLIAVSPLLDKPFTDAPDQSPWTRTADRLRAVTDAAAAITADLALIPREDRP